MENKKIKVVVCITIVLIVTAAAEKIKWIPSIDFDPNFVIPAGYERTEKTGSVEYTNLYVARVKNATNWIPGKYWPTDSKCFVGANGKEIEKPESECELLVFPKGTTSWIYTSSTGILPDDLVKGGSFYNSDKMINLYLCRARKDGQVLLGRLNTRSTKRTCYTTSSGVEYKHKEYEVLTTNFLAKVTQTNIQE